MNPLSLSESESTVLHGLHGIVRHTEQALLNACGLKNCPAVSRLIESLALRHRAQAAELQHRITSCAMTAPIVLGADRGSCWSELDDAMASSDRNVVLAACELAQHLIANAYTKALGERALSEATRTLLYRHLHDALVAEELLRDSVLPAPDRKQKLAVRYPEPEQGQLLTDL